MREASARIVRYGRKIVPARVRFAAYQASVPRWRVENWADDEAARCLIRVAVTGGRSMVDVGANRGELLAAAVEAAADSQHYAIEPVDWLATRLTTRFPTVRVLPVVAGDRERLVEFYEYNRDTRSSLSAITTETVKRVTQLKMVRLDDVIDRSADISVLKIDVEGHELDVLRGADRLLGTCRPLIIFEHGSPAGGEREDSTPIFNLLESFGYCCSRSAARPSVLVMSSSTACPLDRCGTLSQYRMANGRVTGRPGRLLKTAVG